MAKRGSAPSDLESPVELGLLQVLATCRERPFVSCFSMWRLRWSGLSIYPKTLVTLSDPGLTVKGS